jgi:WD40 repeat protein
MAFSPDGASVAIADADGRIRLRDPATGSVVKTLDGHEGGATSLAFSPDGKLLACGEGHGGSRLWEAGTGRLIRTCKAAGSRAGSVTTDRLFTTVALGPDGTYLATCPATMGNTYGEPVRFWDTRSGELRGEFAGRDVRGRPIALSPNGAVLATGGKSVKLWDVRTGRLLRELTGHLKKTQSLAFSADGRLLVGGGSYGTTNAWEVETGRHLITLFAFPEPRDGAVADAWLAYHPDGFYDGSPGVERFLAWRVGDDLRTPDTIGRQFHRPDQVESSLRGQPR